tara:strand:- start:816 stop:2147 length:1332 start_codon:yes stop_codon:yes gene_type:complete
MISFLSKNNKSSIFLNFLFILIPASFIAGNTILNLNILLLIFLTIFFYGKRIINIKIYILDKIIFLLFSFIIIIGIYNFINLQFFVTEQRYDFSINISVLAKTFSYIRYLILYFILRFLIEEKIINLKIFFISCSIFSLFVSFDVIYQFIFGKDIFGYEPSLGRKFAGPFGEEYIAGGYIQRFFLFSFFLIPFFLKDRNKIIFFLFGISLFLIYMVAIILSGNRMPLVLFIFMTILIFLFEKKIRRYLIYFLPIIFIILITSYHSNVLIKQNFSNLYKQLFSITEVLKTKQIHNTFKKKGMNSYFLEFRTFYGTWQMNKYTGGGVKSFRINCWKRKHFMPGERTTCNTHPHNYYLEILTDLGLVGFIIFSLIFAIVIYRSFINKYFVSSSLNNNNIITPFMFLFFIEIFPLKSSGSFFTTHNATYIFLIMAITVALFRSKNLN